MSVTIGAKFGATADEVWTYADRELTGIKGTPRSDLMGEDASFEAGAGARKLRIDETPAFEARVEQSIAMDGTERTLIEKADDKMGITGGFVDLSPMQAGDTIVVREYLIFKAGGSYRKHAEETYRGAQSLPALSITPRVAARGFKVTAQQTAGANRTLDVIFLRRRER